MFAGAGCSSALSARIGITAQRYLGIVTESHGWSVNRLRGLPAADGLDEKVAQFSDRQSLYNAPVFVIENQAALAIDFHAAGHALLDFTLAAKSEGQYERHSASRAPYRLDRRAAVRPPT